MTKTLVLTINGCRNCPYYQVWQHNEPPTCKLSNKPLPFEVRTDSHDGSKYAHFIGGVAEWCEIPTDPNIKHIFTK